MPTPTRVTWRFYPEPGPFAMPSHTPCQGERSAERHSGESQFTWRDHVASAGRPEIDSYSRTCEVTWSDQFTWALI
eukprot:2650296-Rhodomonas_salina.1